MARRHSSKKLKLFNTGEPPFFSFIFLVFVSFLLMGLDYRMSIHQSIKQATSYLDPVIIFITNLPHEIEGGLKDNFTTKSALLKEKIELENKILELSIENQKLNLITEENKALRKSLQISKILIHEKTTAAEIILPNIKSGKQIILINKGSRDNIKIGSPVINNLGLIGQVIFTKDNYSEILPITSRDFMVPAILERGTDNVIIKGNGLGYLEVMMMPWHREVNIGDTFMTSGIDEIYPKGIKIGKVINVSPLIKNQFNHLLIAPISDPRTLSQVKVFQSKSK